MNNLKACMVCFSTDVKLYSLNTCQLRQEFNFISGIQTCHGDGMPEYLCFLCSALVKNFIKFRNRCHRAHRALKEILCRNKEINQTNLEYCDRNLLGIMPPLAFMTLDRTHYEKIYYENVQWEETNCIDWCCNTSKQNIVVAHCSTLTSDDTFDEVTNTRGEELKFSEDKIKIDIDSNPEKLFIEFPHFQAKDESSALDSTPEDAEIDSDDNGQESDKFPKITLVDENTSIDGTKINGKYATMIPISMKEAKAAMEVDKMFSNGKYNCQICNKGYNNKKLMKIHLRLHDKYLSGNYHCDICRSYYKTELLLNNHMTEKHTYKYLCTKCPEVNFDRTSANQHYICTHSRKKSKKKYANGHEKRERPKRLNRTREKRSKRKVTLNLKKRNRKLPDDFLIYSPIGHEEQYRLVQERQQSRNYQGAKYQCTLCYRGFVRNVTYTNHMKKHDPALSGPLQCDICKLYYKDTLKMYKHMNISHLYKYSCQLCSYVCVNRCQAQAHYKWHKNVKYQCPHCNMEFMKASTRLSHIRIKHPSMYLCNICGHSFVSDFGLNNHKQIVHSEEEIEQSKKLEVNTSDPHYCADCETQFMSFGAFTTHFGSSYKHATTNISIKPSRRMKPEERRPRGRPRRNACSEIVNRGVSTSSTCEVCGVLLANDMQAHKHYKSEHPKYKYLKRYMCDVCGHTTRHYAALTVHMRTHTVEKPYECPHCDRRFKLASKRDKHIYIHTGEKRYECQHCKRRFTQSSAVRLHIQTVHLKIPYAPWTKRNRKKRKDSEVAGESKS